MGALRAQLTRDRAEIETWLDDVSKVSPEYKIGLGPQTDITSDLNLYSLSAGAVGVSPHQYCILGKVLERAFYSNGLEGGLKLMSVIVDSRQQEKFLALLPSSPRPV
jgi:hypothetical protein